jgi:hypothetical protein
MAVSGTSSDNYLSYPTRKQILGKVPGINSNIANLYINNHIIKYRLPYIWKWQKDDEVAVFINNYGAVIHKESLDFWKLDIYLDENNFYLNHKKTEYGYGLCIFYNQEQINRFINRPVI